MMNRFSPLAMLLAPLILLPACGEAVEDNHFARDVQEARPASAPVTTQAVPVRIGELGPSFPACNATGVTRNLQPGEALAVRAAPFETAEETGQVPAGSRFFICARSHDQKWFGIVFPADGDLRSCDVSAPVPSRRDYQGPCSSGWVTSPLVKLTSGMEQPQQAQE